MKNDNEKMYSTERDVGAIMVILGEKGGDILPKSSVLISNILSGYDTISQFCLKNKKKTTPKIQQNKNNIYAFVSPLFYLMSASNGRDIN